MPTTDYLIARHLVRLEGAALHEALPYMPGFLPFRTEAPSGATPNLAFRWEETALPPTSLSFETSGNIRLYEVESEGVRSFLFREKAEPVYHFLAENITTGQRFAFCYRPGIPDIHAQGEASPDMLRFALWIAYGLTTVATRTIAIHSSAICYQGRAVLFLGESGTGKSTHTRLWQQYIESSFLLNDDSPILQVTEGVPTVFGSPWSGKTPCYKPEFYPLAALVRLTQAPHNRIRRLRTLEAFGAVFPSCPPAFAPDTFLSDHLCSTLSDVLTQVPVYALECLPDCEAAQVACKSIFSK